MHPSGIQLPGCTTTAHDLNARLLGVCGKSEPKLRIWPPRKRQVPLNSTWSVLEAMLTGPCASEMGLDVCSLKLGPLGADNAAGNTFQVWDALLPVPPSFIIEGDISIGMRPRPPTGPALQQSQASTSRAVLVQGHPACRCGPRLRRSSSPRA